MIAHTLEFDTSLTGDDIQRYQYCSGVRRATGYDNTLTLEYLHPLGEHEYADLARAVRTTLDEGGTILSIELCGYVDTHLIKEALRTHLGNM